MSYSKRTERGKRAGTSRRRSRSPAAVSLSHRARSQDICQICRFAECPCLADVDNSTAIGKQKPMGSCNLVSVCQCRGLVHGHCLAKRLQRTLETSCEVCGRFYPLWALPKEALRRQQELELVQQETRANREQQRLLELQRIHQLQCRLWEEQAAAQQQQQQQTTQQGEQQQQQQQQQAGSNRSNRNKNRNGNNYEYNDDEDND